MVRYASEEEESLINLFGEKRYKSGSTCLLQFLLHNKHIKLDDVPFGICEVHVL